jgi:hypothetical protein
MNDTKITWRKILVIGLSLICLIAAFAVPRLPDLVKALEAQTSSVLAAVPGTFGQLADNADRSVVNIGTVKAIKEWGKPPLPFGPNNRFRGLSNGSLEKSYPDILDRKLYEPKQTRAFKGEQRMSEAERKHFEDNKTMPITGQFPPESKAIRKIRLNGHFIASDNGIVMDTKSGLEWIAGPDRDTAWAEARSWVQSLSVNGGGWRMPTREELKSLYKKGAGTRNMTTLLKTTGWWVWSGEIWGAYSARIFSFHYGYELSHPLIDSSGCRVFAVRSGK